MFPTQRSRRAAKAAAFVILIVGALACEGEDGVHSDRPPTDRKVDPAKKRTAAIKAEGSGPYDIWVRAAKAGQVRGDYTREKVAGGAYRQTLDYTSGLKIEITVTVSGHRSDIFSCEISDGVHRSRERAAGTVQCKLTTSQ